MPTDDFSRHREGYRNALNRLDDADIPEADRTAIRGFLNDKAGDCEFSSLKHYCTVLMKSAERTDAPLLELTEADAKAYFTDLRTNPEYGRSGAMSTASVGNYMAVLAIFWSHYDREWADDIDPDRLDPDEKAVNPNDILEPDDVQTLVDAAGRQREVAIIQFLADTGARLGLIGSLRVQDVDLDGESATYTPNDEALGLKGAKIKPYPIIDSRAALRTYLRQTHPRPNEPDAALFHKYPGKYDEGDVSEDDGAMTPSGIRYHLSKVAERAGVEKPTNPHNFRHSAVTRMWREGYSKGQIQHRVHWTVDTNMWDTYVHLAAERVNDDIFEAAGVVDGDGGADRQRRRCGNCTEIVPPKAKYCAQCGDPVDPDERDQQARVIETSMDDMVDGATPYELRLFRKFLDGVRNDPEFRRDHQAPASESDASSR